MKNKNAQRADCQYIGCPVSPLTSCFLPNQDGPHQEPAAEVQEGEGEDAKPGPGCRRGSGRGQRGRGEG